MSSANYSNAKRILKNSEARISQSSEGIYDQNAVVIFWDAVEARYLDECVNYLNDPDEQPVLTGPTQFFDCLFTDNLYHLHAYYDEDADRPDSHTRQQRIYRILMRNPISYSATNWDSDTTKWKLYGGDTYTHGPSTRRTLYMQNVTHDDAIDFETQVLDDSYTDAIYLFGGDSLSGEWFSIERKSEVNPRTGLYTLYWFLSKYNNTDLYFKIQAGMDTIRGFYYKWEATEDTLAVLIDTLRFEDDGSIDTDPDSETSATLQEKVTGRTVLMRRTSRDPEDRLFDVEIEIIWADKYQLSDSVVGFITYHKSAAVDVQIDQGYNIPGSLLATIKTTYAALDANQQATFDFQRNKDDGTFDFTASITTRNCRNGYVDAGGSWIIFGAGVVSNSPISAPTDIGVNLTWATFKAALSAFEVQGNTRVEDDGTFAYNLQVKKPATSFNTFPNTVSHTLTAIDKATKTLSFSGTLPAWITAGCKLLIEGTSADLSFLSGVWKVSDVANGAFDVTLDCEESMLSEYTGSSSLTLTVDPLKASAITQRWVDTAIGSETLPDTADTVSSFDEKNGSWYNEVDYKYEVVGPGLYNWTIVTIRHQIVISGFRPCGITRKWKKEHVVFARSPKRVIMKNRGQWKTEVIPWMDDWTAPYVGTDNPPPSWLSSGNQAKYGDWKSYFIKASKVAGNGDDYGCFIGRSGTGSFLYDCRYFGQRVSADSRKFSEGGVSGWSGVLDLATRGDLSSQTGSSSSTSWFEQKRALSSDSISRNMSYGYENISFGYATYDHEVLQLKTYDVLEEYIRWNPTWAYISGATYVSGAVITHNGQRWKSSAETDEEPSSTATYWEATTEENPTTWDQFDYVSRYGDWKDCWKQAAVQSGDQVGDFIGIIDSSAQAYYPPPETTLAALSFLTNQSGIVGGSGTYNPGTSSLIVSSESGSASGRSYFPVTDNWSIPRNITDTYTPQVYGFSKFNASLVRATVLNESGQPELGDGASITYTTDWYEQSAFTEAGSRVRIPTTVSVCKYYTAVNPAFIEKEIVPSSLCALGTVNSPLQCHAHYMDSNAETTYSVDQVSEFLWAVTKQVVRYGPAEPDTIAQTSDPNRGATGGKMNGEFENFPQVDQNGCYQYSHAPMVSNTILGKAPTTGVYPTFKVVN